MQTYAAVDLHSNNGVLAIIDESDRVLKQKRIRNELSLFINELEPFRASLQGVAVDRRSTGTGSWTVCARRTSS